MHFETKLDMIVKGNICCSYIQSMPITEKAKKSKCLC